MSIQYGTRPWDLKSLNTDGSFAGYGSVFGKLDQQNEIVMPGAFSKSLSKARLHNQTPAMLWMHDPTWPIGVWTALREDENGLSVEGRLALRTQKGMEAYELLKMGALTGLSIGYRVKRSQIDGKRKARLLTEVDLFEISLVTFPANEEARVHSVKRHRRADDDDTKRAIVYRLHQTARILQNNPPSH